MTFPQKKSIFSIFAVGVEPYEKDNRSIQEYARHS